MHQNISEFDFKNQFKQMRPENFSYDGLTALYDYLTEYEDSTETKVELDVIAFCCEFTEFDSIEEVKINYDVENLKELEEKTTVIRIPKSKGLIVQNY